MLPRTSRSNKGVFILFKVESYSGSHSHLLSKDYNNCANFSMCNPLQTFYSKKKSFYKTKSYSEKICLLSVLRNVNFLRKKNSYHHFEFLSGFIFIH